MAIIQITIKTAIFIRRLFMKISGRNKIKGKVSRMVSDSVCSEVELDAGSGIRITGLITKESVDDLGIKVGDDLTALIKATSVMFIKE